MRHLPPDGHLIPDSGRQSTITELTRRTPAGAGRRRRGRRRWRWIAISVLMVLVLVAAEIVAVSLRVRAPAKAALPPPPAGWSLVWSDDFEGAAGGRPQDWIIDTGHSYGAGAPDNWGTGEIQRYTDEPANVKLDGTGNLLITPLKGDSGEWTSARIETKRANFKPPAGGLLRIEGRIQMPDVSGAQAQGYWPAFWALGSPYRGNYQNWPSIGEFDIMENVNGLNSVWGVLHCGVNPGGPCKEKDGLGTSRACPDTACQAGMHVYRFEWDSAANPQQLRWYVDGQQFHSVTQADVGASTWADMTSHDGYFLLLNVAMGGQFPNGQSGATTPTAETISGRPMIVDYVAVWRSGGA